MTYFLIIKGSANQAHWAAAVHHIDLFDLREGEFGSCGAKADVKASDLIDWFLETNEPAPFPAGTLLFYQPVEEASHDEHL